MNDRFVILLLQTSILIKICVQSQRALMKLNNSTESKKYVSITLSNNNALLLVYFFTFSFILILSLVLSITKINIIINVTITNKKKAFSLTSETFFKRLM